jgi:xanthine dehydrogenase accessory factor
MIGSKRKREAIYESLLDEGVPRERLEAVHSPIGVEIDAETPEEIAVSIVGELIKARAERSRSEGKRNCPA